MTKKFIIIFQKSIYTFSITPKIKETKEIYEYEDI